uniref:Sec-independent protein translocase component TatC n=1 Tax=Vischeria stellata TaxID=1104407 RepID=A0A481XIH8_9STRA|nr:Sec-independent protein translocase component TatC [Vischeria stellata]QBK36848.1 Sec-independent protein translocase component TatC [Vischeria stellata]
MLFNDDENNENIESNGLFIAGELTETFFVFFKLGIFIFIYSLYPIIIFKTILWFLPTGTKINKLNFSQILFVYFTLFISIIWIVHNITLPILWRFFSYEGLGTNIIETEIGLNHIVMFTIKNYIIFIFLLHQTIIKSFQNHFKANLKLFDLDLRLNVDSKPLRFKILKLIYYFKFNSNTKLNNVFPMSVTKFIILKNLHVIVLKNLITKIKKILFKNLIKLTIILFIILGLETLYELKLYIIFILYYLIMFFLIMTHINIKYKANNGI